MTPTSHLSSLGQLFREQAQRHPERAFLYFRPNDEWCSWTWQQVDDRVRALGAALIDAGLQAGDRVAILSENRPEWLVADLACLSLGLVDVPIYATSPSVEVLHALRDSGSRLIFVSNAEQWSKITPIRDELPRLERVVSFERMPDPNEAEWLEDWLDVGRTREPEAFDLRLAAVARDDLASLLYTSGTTGEPKGVMLTHGNFLSNCESVLKHVRVSPEDRTLSFLPLSHSFERTAGHYTLMMAGGEIAYATDLERVAVELKEIQPTVVMGVPRFYEKMKARVTGAIERSPYWRRKLFRLAMRVGERVFNLPHLQLHHPAPRRSVGL